MFQELHSKLIAARNFELTAKFWDWYILLRASGAKGRISCFWDQEQDCLGYNSPDRLWEVAVDLEQLDEQMRDRGYPLSAIPLELWHEDTRENVESLRLAKVLGQ